MRLAFAGTPDFAAVALRALYEAGHEIAVVLTQPDRPAGRGMKLQASPVKQTAQPWGVPILQPRSLRLDGRWSDEARGAQEALAAIDVDVMIVAAYGLILPRWVLQWPRLGCLNIHGSLLPRWRGAAPIHRAIEAGDTETGITIMQMDEGLDTGDMLLTEVQPIRPEDTTATLHDRLAAQGARLMVEALARLEAGTLHPTRQPAAGVSYAHKIDKSEAALDWRADAAVLERRIRAFDPFPGASLVLGEQVIKVWRAAVVASPHATGVAPGTVLAAQGDRLQVACGAGALELQEVQAPGGRRVPAAALLASAAGRGWQPGIVLPTPEAPASTTPG
jgi:methionyl-tRNA formyltransferase